MRPTDLEQVVSAEAERFAAHLPSIVAKAVSEEDVRHECNKLLDDFVELVGLPIRARHEYGLAGGQIDSKYSGVIIEYKNPNGAERLTSDGRSRGVRAVLRQIEKRFSDFERVERIDPATLFGVGTDGRFFVFVRQRGTRLDIEGPHPATKPVLVRLLRALISLGSKGGAFTPTNLARDFGAESLAAQKGIRELYRVLVSSDKPKVLTLFRQWMVLFSEVSGREVQPDDKRLVDLGNLYEIEKPDAARLLYALHTYYALLMKFLAAEIVGRFGAVNVSPLRRCVGAATSGALKRELQLLEQGGIWAQLGISNFLEGDLFAWYVDAWDERVVAVVHALLWTLDEYDPSTLGVESTESHDLVKALYQQLFPRSVRRNLGEYYTPDWLAIFVLDEVGYDGNPDKRVLDPACGSGTFLVLAVERTKAWFKENRHQCGYDEKGLIERILANLIGFDLNPVAVMAARTNFLLAIRDLLKYSGKAEIPIYLCDSIVTPVEYGDLFTDGHGKSKRLRSAVGDFLIPAEVTEDRTVVGRYADLLEFCVRHQYSGDEFIERCHEVQLQVNAERLHRDLYDQLLKLADSDQNGIWARIIKNAFAPVFTGKVDFVVGNPPWINWLELPEAYRQDSEHIWRDYGLLTLSGWKAKVAAGRVDLAILFVVVAIKSFLDAGGKLGFVITQSVFKSTGGGEGFRRFSARDDQFAPVRVHDFSGLALFEDAVNRAAVAIFEKGRAIEYPVPYIVWRPVRRRSAIPPHIERSSLERYCSPVEEVAVPSIKSNALSPWLTGSPPMVAAIRKILGANSYRAREGVNWGGALGAFQLVEVTPAGRGLSVVVNDAHAGRIKVAPTTAAVEDELVFPLVKGRDVARWYAKPRRSVLMTHLAGDPKHAISETEMKVRFPKAYSYLVRHKKQLTERKEYKRWGAKGPFYELYRIGQYTFAPFKVVFKDLTELFQAAVVSADGGGKVIIPDYTLRMIPFENEEEAFYIAALLNSAPAVLALYATSVGVQTQRYHAGDLDKLLLPVFSSRDASHVRLSGLSRECHVAAGVGELSSSESLEREVDEVASQVWGVTAGELREIWSWLDAANRSTSVREQS